MKITRGAGHRPLAEADLMLGFDARIGGSRRASLGCRCRIAGARALEFRGDGEDAHGPVFKKLHQYLLGIAENLSLYSCAEYKKSGKRYCSLLLTENYC